MGATRTTLALVLALLVGATAMARAEVATWQPEVAGAAAAELAEAAVALRAGLRRRQPRDLPRSGRQAFYSLLEEARVLESTSRRLNRALAGGAGMEETYPTFRRLVRTGRRARRDARRIDLGQDTLLHIDAMAEAIGRLRPFYEPDSPL